MKKAVYKGEYKIEVQYKDGSVSLYDFEKWLYKNRNTFYGRYYNLELFKKFRIHHDKLSWGRGHLEMDFPEVNLKEFEVKQPNHKNSTSLEAIS